MSGVETQDEGPGVPEGFVPITFSADSLLERYGGWTLRREAAHLRVLSKKHGFITKYLILSRGEGSREVGEVVRNLLKDPLSILILHDYASHTPTVVHAGKTFTEVAAGERLLNRATFLIDLHQEKDLLWRNMEKQGARDQVSKATRLGAEARFVQPPEAKDLDRFFEHYLPLAREKGLDIPSRATLEKMALDGRLLYAETSIPQRAELSGLLVYLAGDYSVETYAFSHNKGNTGAGRHLKWELFQHLKAKGLRWFDLGGIPSLDPANGIYTFKKVMGGRLTDLGTEYQYMSPGIAAAYSVFRGLKSAGRRVSRART